MYHRTILDWTHWMHPCSNRLFSCWCDGQSHRDWVPRMFGSSSLVALEQRNAQFDQRNSRVWNYNINKLHTMRYYFNATGRCFDFFAMHMCSTIFFPIINVPSLYLFLNKKQHHFHWLHTKTIRNWWVNHVFLPAIFAATVLNEQIHSSVLFPHTFYLWTTSTPQLSRLAWLTVMAPPSTAYIPPFPFRPSSATSVPSRGWWFGR